MNIFYLAKYFTMVALRKGFHSEELLKITTDAMDSAAGDEDKFAQIIFDHMAKMKIPLGEIVAEGMKGME